MYINQDKDERVCIETFYNDTSNDDVSAATGGAVCAGDYENAQSIATEDLQRGNDRFNSNVTASTQQETANMGPAYVPIRAKKFYAGLNFTWSPVYGKQLLFLSNTNFFDVYFTFAGGAMMSDFFASKQEFAPGQQYRQTRMSTGSTMVAGVSPNDTTLYAVSYTHLTLPTKRIV